MKQHHTTGLVWAGKGTAVATGVPPPPPPGCPPPVFSDIPAAIDPNQDRSALFAQINQGENITRSQCAQAGELGFLISLPVYRLEEGYLRDADPQESDAARGTGPLQDAQQSGVPRGRPRGRQASQVRPGREEMAYCKFELIYYD